MNSKQVGRTVGPLLLLGSVLAGWLSPCVAQIDTQSRLQSVERLVESSSAARKVQDSGNRAAQAKREEARRLYREAQHEAGAGKLDSADRLLRQATQTLFEAVRMVDKDESLVQKAYIDFDARLASINALCDAHDRIRREKGLGPATSSELYPLVHSKLDRARSLRDTGRVSEGRKVLDEAYVAAKVAIEHLRGGDTLVRSLNFANKEEEYHYEVDRNDTHRMLVDVLLQEKMRDSSGVNTMVKSFMDKADKLRDRADEQATGGDYAGAVDTLEQSTREIVRAIRSAGIYIPG